MSELEAIEEYCRKQAEHWEKALPKNIPGARSLALEMLKTIHRERACCFRQVLGFIAAQRAVANSKPIR